MQWPGFWITLQQDFQPSPLSTSGFGTIRPTLTTRCWETDSYVTLQSLLSFILWRFTVNNNGNPDAAKEAIGTLPERISNDCFPQRTIHEICTQSHRFHDIHSPTGTGVDILLGGFLLASLFRPPAPEYLVIPAGRLRQQIAYDFAR